MKPPFVLSTVTIVCVCALLLAACGQETKPAATQVAAKVNKEEISVHQINYVLQRQGAVRPEQAASAGRQILERLIDQEVAIQKARDQKLDRDPAVMQEIEQMRREILARAYVNRVGEATSKPTDDEIKAYFEGKPALFADRHIYTMQEMLVEADKDKALALQAALPKFKSIVELGEYLKAQQLPVRVTQNATPAENVPMQMLDRLAALKEGQTTFSTMPSGARLVTLLQVRSAPLTLEQARPAIEQYLANDHRRKAIEQDIKTIRTAAQIEYVGQFADASKPTESAAAAASAPVERRPAVAATAASGLDAASVSKGLSGLK